MVVKQDLLTRSEKRLEIMLDVAQNSSPPLRTHIIENYLANWVMETHAFNPNTRRKKQVDLREFEVSLVYKATQRNPVSKKELSSSN